MAYTVIAQNEHDTLSDPTESPPLSPNEQQNLLFQRLSTDLVPLSPLSEIHEPSISRQGSVLLRHPTPDLQSLQGAYLGNIERLEQSAERLSTSSDIGEELRKISLEQRRSGSRGSSILNAHAEESGRACSTNRRSSHGHGSHASDSIVGTNNVARSGGYSPAAYFASPRSSIRSETWSRSSMKGRSTSQGSRLTQLQEPDVQQKRLDLITSAATVSHSSLVESPSKALRVINDAKDANGVEIPRPLNISPRKQQDAIDDALDHPATTASTNTYQQFDGLFHDFDGIHAIPQPQFTSDDHDTSNNNARPDRRTVSDRPKSFLEPLPGENMVYYPAPVPMMLNLPQRLSKMPSAPSRDKRRTQILEGLPPDARKSAAWLHNVSEGEDEDSRFVEHDPHLPHQDSEGHQAIADVPPQLRASVFFDYPAIRQDVEVKGESAVATLDSILDASAFAPVTAFTDHPIVGHVGADVYGRSGRNIKARNVGLEQTDKRKRRSSMNFLQKKSSDSDLVEEPKRRSSSYLGLSTQFGKRKSSGQVVSDPTVHNEAKAANLHVEETPLQVLDHEDPCRADGDAVDEDADFHDAEEFQMESGDVENAESEQYNGQPTTLLAELHLRKQQLKQRNRTAATAFPDGMHSTLLELDAVAQVQRQSRKQKHVTLAWEDPATHQSAVENEDDEDVPLGMLFPSHQKNAQNRASCFAEDRPLGLIARREMEDNEPLSRRRARLRGEDTLPRSSNAARLASMYTLDVPDLESGKEEIPEIESETLAQRARRLRGQNSTSQSRPASGDFSNEIMSQFGGLPADAGKLATEPAGKAHKMEEETLGQRRKRLNVEREGKLPEVSGGSGNASSSKPRLSSRHSMADLLQAHPTAGARMSSSGHQTQWALKQQQNSPGYLAMASGFGLLGATRPGMIPAAGPVMNSYTPNPLVYSHPMYGAAGGIPYGSPGGLQMGRAPMELDPRQRDTIDRWRQSVMY